MIQEQQQTGRLAPSPSGRMHLGNAYSFLVAWAIARQAKARLILRMDDLDDRCKKQEFKDGVLRDLEWLRIDWDGEVQYQSNRLELYQEVWECVKKTNLIYPCFCSRADLHASSAPHASDGTPIYSGKCKKLSVTQLREKFKEKCPAWRIEVPDEKISFTDEIYGKYSQSLEKEAGDFILMRSDGIFSYDFANCIDDLEMGVTQIVRGSDLIPSVSRQIWLKNLIAETMSDTFCTPLNVKYYHLPLLMNEEGLRLAKRDKSLSLEEIRNAGVKPEVVIAQISNLIGMTNNCQEMSSDDFLASFNLNLLKGKQDIVVKADLFKYV